MIQGRKISSEDSIVIQYGDITKIPQLKQLWKECFADEDAYISDFFEAMYEDEHVLLAEKNGMLMGASFFLPGNIWLEQPGTSGKWQPVRYVYALAVWPEYRGRGIAAKLLRQAYELYHAPLIAEPAEEGLVRGFYKPLGFDENFYLKNNTIEIPQYNLRAAEADEWEWIPVNAAQYCILRDTHFQKHGYISWPQQHVAFAISQHRSNEGGAYVLHAQDREELILYFIENQDVIVTETTLHEKEWMHILIPRLSGACSRIVVATAAAGCADKLIGMSYGLSSVYGYLNLSLD